MNDPLIDDTEFSPSQVLCASGAIWNFPLDFHQTRRPPHILLSSGRHSDSFCNMTLLMQDPVILAKFARRLAHRIAKDHPSVITRVDRVVGPAMGGIPVAIALATAISELRDRTCLYAYAERVPQSSGVGSSLAAKRFSLKKGERILLCEDVITTGGSADEAGLAAEMEGCQVLPYFTTFVNRSGQEELKGKPVVSLIDFPMKTYAPSECPLCFAGSTPIAIQTAKDWENLISWQSPR